MDKEEKQKIKDRLIRWGNVSFDLSERREEHKRLTESQIADEYGERICSLNAEIKRLIDEETVIYNALRILNRRERHIVYYRYRDDISWDSISELMRLSRMQCFRIHDKALEKIHGYLKEK